MFRVRVQGLGFWGLDVAPSTVKNHGSEAGRRNSAVAGAKLSSSTFRIWLSGKPKP